MGRKMIAPTLRCSDAVDAKCHPAMCECVSERMRALEAVARAADRHFNRAATTDERAYWEGIDRVKAALSRLSRPKRKGER